MSLAGILDRTENGLKYIWGESTDDKVLRWNYCVGSFHLIAEILHPPKLILLLHRSRVLEEIVKLDSGMENPIEY